MRWEVPGLVFCWLMTSAPPAAACSFGPQVEHRIDASEQALDDTPPSAVEGASYSVQRGVGPRQQGCGQQMMTSCDDIGLITLEMGQATDDRTQRGALGYRLEVVAGAAPPDAGWPTVAVRADDGGRIFLPWVDGSSDEQEAFDLTFRVRAVDLAGNEGPPTELRIRDAGEGEGCRVADAGRGEMDLSLPGLGVLVLVLRSLRRSGSRARARPDAR
jgi:hypothetical protein